VPMFAEIEWVVAGSPSMSARTVCIFAIDHKVTISRPQVNDYLWRFWQTEPAEVHSPQSLPSFRRAMLKFWLNYTIVWTQDDN